MFSKIKRSGYNDTGPVYCQYVRLCVLMEVFSVGIAGGIRMKNIFDYQERQMLF